jgi:2-keto-3-deoxy-L-rhamnonate aldolase RhmA
MMEYFKEVDQRTLVMVQIETVDGFKNVEEIAKVDGLGELTFK